MIKLHDKYFEPYISKDEIEDAITQLAESIRQHYENKNPLLVCVLNGSFIFCSDLVKKLDFPLQIEFIKVKSYEGTETLGNVEWLLDIHEDISGREVIIIEDIVDTGHTLAAIHAVLATKHPKSIKIASLLFKKECYKMDYPIDYVGIEIENKFVVGYGMDYDEIGRNLPFIYKLKN